MFRIGWGYDIHRLDDGGTVTLGTVKVDDFSRHLVGHSDADVVLHAIIDAFLGAAGLGDIGTLFPDTDSQYRGADSAGLFAHAWQQVLQQGLVLGNADVTIHAQQPRLEKYKQPIRLAVARLFDCEPAQVNIKAKTAERCDAVGRGEAIACSVAVLLNRRQ